MEGPRPEAVLESPVDRAGLLVEVGQGVGPVEVEAEDRATKQQIVAQEVGIKAQEVNIKERELQFQLAKFKAEAEEKEKATSRPRKAGSMKLIE